MGIAENVFKVRGQRSRSQRDQKHFCGGGMHIDVVASRLTCCLYTCDRTNWLSTIHGGGVGSALDKILVGSTNCPLFLMLLTCEIISFTTFCDIPGLFRMFVGFPYLWRYLLAKGHLCTPLWLAQQF